MVSLVAGELVLLADVWDGAVDFQPSEARGAVVPWCMVKGEARSDGG
jgi:hypothetical protein